jgi:hypothetical protein
LAATAEQSARLTRCIDSDRHPVAGIETAWLITSRPAHVLSAAQMLDADRRYWSGSKPASICAWMPSQVKP